MNYHSSSIYRHCIEGLAASMQVGVPEKVGNLARGGGISAQIGPPIWGVFWWILRLKYPCMYE